jgi:hypothetical protein
MAYVGEPSGFQLSDTGPEDGRLLVVVLHGWMGTPTQMNDVVQAVRGAYAREPALDLYVPLLPYTKFFSFTPAAEIVSQLLAAMDAICRNPARYARVVLIGFSLGALLVRRLFLAATDVAKTVPSEPQLAQAGRRSWVGKVERIVSLGGLNRGWLGSGRLGWAESFVTNTIGLMGHIWPGAGKPTIFEARRGAPFVVQTRLQWLALRRSRDPEKPEPLVIQLLGTQDSLVAPDDAVDFAVDRSAASPYFYVELPYTRHDNAIVFSPSRFDRDGKFGAARQARFVEVLTSDKNTLAKMAVPADYLADALPDEPDEAVEHVVFVVHGIRDNGYWTRKIAQKIRESAARAGTDPSIWRCVTSSYGYFAMLPFLLPWIRRQKVEWLMDEYVGVRSRFPNAAFSYVGHSNGTYLVARALQDYPAAQFHHVLFAGSVVRRDYDWAALVATQRVHKVLNMVATRDWVVALFPKGLEPVRRFFDLGGAGFGGFNQAGLVPNVDEVRYVIGGHAAGLVETQWSRIADFIVHGTVPEPPDRDYTDKQSGFWWCASKVSTMILALLVVATAAILVWMLYPLFTPGTTATKATVHILLALLYVIALRFVVTRV